MMSFWTSLPKMAFLENHLMINWEKYNPQSKVFFILMKKDLRIEKLDLSMQDLVNEILSSKIIDNEEKCILLYETTNYIGDNSFDEFVKDVSFKCSRDEALRISKKNSETIVFKFLFCLKYDWWLNT